MKDENKSNLLLHLFIVVIVGVIFILLSCLNLVQASATVERSVEPLVPQGEFLPHIPDRELTMPNLIRLMAKEHGLASWEAERLIKIWTCESHLIPTAQNKTSSAAGIAQIIRGTWNANSDKSFEEYRYNAEENIKTGIRIYQRRGFSPWVCKNLI